MNQNSYIGILNQYVTNGVGYNEISVKMHIDLQPLI